MDSHLRLQYACPAFATRMYRYRMSSLHIRRRIVGMAMVAAVALAVLTSAGLSVAATDGAETTSSPILEREALGRLMAMLALIPDDEETRSRLSATAYVDYRAAERAGGLTGPVSRESLAAMDVQTFDRWAVAMSRIALGPVDMSREIGREQTARRLPDVGSLFRGLPAVLGIDWFAIDQSALSGGPDGWVMLRVGAAMAEPTNIQTALAAKGFQRKDVSGVPVWHRFSDGELREDAAFPGDILGSSFKDPFGVTDGRAARIALFGDVILGASSWKPIESIIGGRTAGKSLADVPDIRAVAEAVAGSDMAGQTLVQAFFVDYPYGTAHDVARARLGMFATDEQLETLARQWKSRPALPPYSFVALADGQVAADEIAVVAVAYSDATTAAEAANILKTRFEDFYVSTIQARLTDAFHARVTARVHETASGKSAVAVITFRSSPRIESVVSDERPGRMFKALLDSFINGDVDPVIVEME